CSLAVQTFSADIATHRGGGVERSARAAQLYDRPHCSGDVERIGLNAGRADFSAACAGQLLKLRHADADSGVQLTAAEPRPVALTDFQRAVIDLGDDTIGIGAGDF